MTALIQSFLLVVATEMGDKTQLLALVLVLKYKKPWVILLGILCATVLNHSLSALLGSWVSSQVPESTLKWILGGVFIAFGFWVLVPDKEDGLKSESRFGPFLSTALLFFVAEMGDKTQLATVALAAKFQSITLVTIGTTLGMLVAEGLLFFWGINLSIKYH